MIIKELLIPDKVAVEVTGSTAIIHFINPQERNPLSINVLETLRQIMDELFQSEEIEKIIITGSGDVFASGANLREIAEVTGETARGYALRGQTLMNKIADSPKPVIAAVNGFCFGGALDLALSCHMRIASPNAVFCHPGASLGIMTGWGGTQRLPRLVGQAAALEMFLTAKRIDAKEALKIGLIDAIDEDPLMKSRQEDDKIIFPARSMKKI